MKMIGLSVKKMKQAEVESTCPFLFISLSRYLLPYGRGTVIVAFAPTTAAAPCENSLPATCV